MCSSKKGINHSGNFHFSVIESDEHTYPGNINLKMQCPCFHVLGQTKLWFNLLLCGLVVSSCLLQNIRSMCSIPIDSSPPDLLSPGILTASVILCLSTSNIWLSSPQPISTIWTFPLLFAFP